MQEKHLVQLETLVAQQDRTLTALHEELYAQQKEIRRLHNRLAALEQKTAHLTQSDEIAAPEKPPHY